MGLFEYVLIRQSVFKAEFFCTAQYRFDLERSRRFYFKPSVCILAWACFRVHCYAFGSQLQYTLFPTSIYDIHLIFLIS